MRKFNVNVNGKSYDVSVTEISKNDSELTPQNKTDSKQVIINNSNNESSNNTTVEPKPSSANINSITAPMPGNIINIKTQVGEKVSKGQSLIVLEAMKMENEITSPFEGVVAQINVKSGDSVAVGQVLITIN